MNQYPPNKMIDFLMIDAQVRLRFERIRKNQQQSKDHSRTIQFLPLAAAGACDLQEGSCFSQDHNFKVSYRYLDSDCICELQAQGHAAIALVRNSSIKICFAEQYFFLAKFNEDGFARLSLPQKTPAGGSWQTLPFAILV